MKPRQSERGLLGVLALLIGGGCVLVALIGAINTAFDLDLAFRVFGSTSTPLPSSYGEVGGLAAVGALIIGGTLFGGLVKRRFIAAKGRPLVRIGILLGALGLITLAGRGLYLVAIHSTYGSMLAYYATDEDTDALEDELADGPSREDLDNAVKRAAQYDNHRALALLLSAGADLRDSTTPADRRGCALEGRGYLFVKTAIDHGVTPDSCPDSDAAIWSAVRFGRDDAEVAKIVTLLLRAGWSASATPSHSPGRTARQLSEQKRWPLTTAALGGDLQSNSAGARVRRSVSAATGQ